MRIRKHSKLSSLLPASSSTLLRTCPALVTHVCQLNQSPWDVMSFSPESSSPCQLRLQDQHQGNGLSSAAASVSEDSSERAEVKEREDDSREERKCDKEGKQGHSMAETPADQRESPRRKSDSAAGTHRRNRGRAVPASDYYYYYSGFGPLWWGKTRRGRRNKRDGSEGGHLKWAPQSSMASTPSSSSSGNVYVNDEEDDGVYRRRGRKPMKSRSLKSLL